MAALVMDVGFCILAKRMVGNRVSYMLNQGPLMLERVTLAQMVELVVKMFVDLAGSAVLDQKATEDTKATHPHDLAVKEYPI